MSLQAIAIRGVFAAAGVASVVLKPAVVDSFNGSWGELSPEARSCWESIARLLPFALARIELEGSSPLCGCAETYPQVIEGILSHGPGCKARPA